MNYKIQFENNLKEMERYIRDAKMAYKSFRNKKDIADDFSYILQYEVVITEYKKYNRDTLNEVILDRMQDDIDELETLVDDFVDEIEDCQLDDYEENELWFLEEEPKPQPDPLQGMYEPYQYEEEEIEEDDYYYEDID
jgi:hypothetical protein